MALTPSQIRNYKGQFAGGWGVEWSGLDLIDSAFIETGKAMHAQRVAVADELGIVMEQYAKQNAPWQDRTGQARDSLHTEVVHTETVSTVWLGYGSDIFYGFYLENYTYGGVQYAIVGPTIKYFGQLLPGYLTKVTL